jgi:hypothetical protein
VISVLYDEGGPCSIAATQPDFFIDLNLDRVVDVIAGPKQEYDVRPLFWMPLRDPETVRYRQEVFRDLEDERVLRSIRRFAEGMALMRRHLAMAERIEFDGFRKGRFLDAATAYCDAVSNLARDLQGLDLGSRGLSVFEDRLARYVQSREYRSLAADAAHVAHALSQVKYCVILESGKFRVKRYEGERDYSPEVERAFQKFKQDDDREHLVHVQETTGASHIEAKILEFVARLYPEPFAELDRFCARHAGFPDEGVVVFDREIQFYVAYLDFIAGLKRRGLPFCYPQVSATSKAVFVRDGFDLALADAWRDQDRPIVLNSFSLEGPERALVVTGPNQGGKTTFARMFGQVHYLAGLGCPVPGREARLFLADRIYTHFERTEDVRSLRGKLEDDLVRVRDALAQATPDSVFILNEVFSSTAAHDTLFLSKEVMSRLMDLNVLSLWVTFLDELASLNEKVVSMVALVDPDDPAKRLFEIVRKPADGLAYALSLARKHGLTYEQVLERIP